MTSLAAGTRVRIGVLRLADSAAVLVADARGLFAAAGLDVQVLVEPSWANILDKLTWGLLDAAVILPPLAISAALGLRGARARLVVPMGLTSGGNSIVLGHAAWQAVEPATLPPGALAARLLGWIRAQPAPPRLGVVHMYSTHNLLLRHWLAGAGADPERDYETVVVPPEQVVGVLQQGGIAGFCSGAPWGDVAAAAGAGHVLLGSSALWPGHPEKCLAVAASWAEAQPEALAGLTSALLQAGRICETASEADGVAALLAGIGLPLQPCRNALPGGAGAERIRFAAIPAEDAGPRTIAIADRDHARWFLGQMQRWGWIAPETGFAEINELYRPELLQPALVSEDHPIGMSEVPIH